MAWPIICSRGSTKGNVSACRRVGVSACRRVGVSACRRVGGSACRRVGVSAYRRVGVSAWGAQELYTRSNPLPIAWEPMDRGPQAGIPHSATPEFLSSRLLEETICQAAWAMAVSASFQLDIEHGVRDYSFWR
jgi:hypothetical protein